MIWTGGINEGPNLICLCNNSGTTCVCKAYIPLQGKTPRIGGSLWAIPPMRNFALEIPIFWYLKSLAEPTQTLKFALPPMRTLKFVLPPMQTPNASRWNIGRIGSPTQGAGVGHVHFMLLVSFLVALGTQRKCDIQWNTGLKVSKRFFFEDFKVSTWC